MSLPNDVILRPRFKIELERSNEEVLTLFENAKTKQKDFILTRVDDHVFIKIPQNEQHFWSPQLHLEIIEVEKERSVLHGLFGPKPSVWTMFMFFHFVAAGLFIGFGIWTYTNWSLDYNFTIQLFVTLMMIVVWFVLYFAGRLGKGAGKEEMHRLYWFMNDILEI